MTNADKIRAMSDDELAESLAEEQFRIANVVFQTVGYGLEKQDCCMRSAGSGTPVCECMSRKRYEYLTRED